MEDWTHQLVGKPAYKDCMDWWEKELAQLPNKTRKLKAAMMMIYNAWNI